MCSMCPCPLGARVPHAVHVVDQPEQASHAVQFWISKCGGGGGGGGTLCGTVPEQWVLYLYAQGPGFIRELGCAC